MSPANARARLCEDEVRLGVISGARAIVKQVPGDMMFVRAVIRHVASLAPHWLAGDCGKRSLRCR